MPNLPPLRPISMPLGSSFSRRGLLAAVAAMPLAGCTKLDALNGLNAVTPGDGETRALAEDIYYGRHERQALDVYGPAAPPSEMGAHPVVVFFYGGSWASGRRQDYGFAARALAARGFVVVVPDYRLVPAYAYPAFVQDGAAALRWTVENIARFGGDPNRIGVMGHSAGAYIAMMLTLDRRWLGDIAPIRAAVGLAGPFDFLPFAPNSAADRAFGHVKDARSTQPIAYAGAEHAAGRPPVLLLQGMDDDTVYPHNARNLGAALVASGSIADVKFYDGLGHVGIVLALSKPFRGKATVLADAAGFLQTHLAPK